MNKFNATIVLSGAILLFAITSFAINDTAKSHYDAGYKLIDEKKLDEAEKEMLEAIKIEPDFADAHQELGYIYSQKGVLDKATVECRKSVELDPKDPMAWRTLGSVYFARGLRILSIKAMEKAIEIAPNFADAYYDLAYIYYHIGEETAFNKEILDNAIIHLEKYQALVPTAAKVKQNKDFLESLKKRRAEIGGLTIMTLPETRDDLAKLKLSESSMQRLTDRIAGKTDKEREIDERVGLMIDLLQKHERDEALKESEEILKLNPKNKEALSISAAIYYKKGLYDKAIAQAKTSIDNYPDLSIGYDVLARSYYKKSDKAKTSEMMTKLRALDSKMADELQEQIGKDKVK